MSFKESATAGILTLSIALGGAGCADINATQPTPITEPVPSNTNPSETSTDITVESTDGTTVTIETTIPANPDLEGVAAERLQFTTDLLNLYDESIKDSNPAFNKIGDFITREQIIDYGKTGEGLTVLENKDGNPLMAFVNCPDKVINTFNSAVTEMESYDENYLNFLENNGVRVFMVNRFDESAGTGFTFNKQGLIAWNADQNALDRCVPVNFEAPILAEVFGIKAYNLGGDYSKYVGFIKQDLASMCWYHLYKQTNKDSFLSFARGNYMFAKTYYNSIYDTSFNDQKIQDLINNVLENDLMIPFGDSWSIIKEDCNDRPDWNS